MRKLVKTIVSGDVQGVGYRYTVFHIAHQFKITGFVRNLSDGSVEVQAEGEENELTGFLKAIDLKNGFIQVLGIKTDWKQAENKFTSFEVLRANPL
jgi:acylphosphatase